MEGRCELRTDTRGVASLEAALILCMLMVIWLGIAHFARAHEARQLALTTARSCAWSYSNRGCVGPAPPQCQATTKGAPKAAGWSRTGPALASSQLNESLLLGASVTVAGEHDIPQPRLFGGGLLEIKGRYYVSCNEREQTLAQIAKRGFESLSAVF
ncbi:MAG: pilus assembly protein [Proteobacteria bacterium]|nr:pilus assembly protein [Pseudomonadota bacterium]